MGSTGISWQPDFSCNARGREQIVQARAPGPLYRTKPHITAPEEGSLMSSVEIPERLSIEPIQVARYRAFQETAGGFTLPSAQSTDRHVFFSLPGVVALPAMIYYRTRHFGKPAFSVRINDFTATQYTFVDGDEAERTPPCVPRTTNWSSSRGTGPSCSGTWSSSTRQTRPPFRLRSPPVPLDASRRMALPTAAPRFLAGMPNLCTGSLARAWSGQVMANGSWLVDVSRPARRGPVLPHRTS